MDRPTIDNTNALAQAGSTVDMYLSQAVEMIDRKLGEGYAAEHPELVAACVQSQALDYNATAQAAALYAVADSIGTAASELTAEAFKLAVQFAS